MNYKVLIVEDEFVVANSLRLLLEQANYIVSGIAASAEEAEKILEKQKPDIAILDIRLNGKQSGIDLARKLRSENIAFIYLSANSSQKVLEEAKKTDPYGFLVKPFREKDLLVALDIATYRHKYILESKSRLEQLLQRELEEINNENLAAKERFLKIAIKMQGSIPFDFVVFGVRPFKIEQYNDLGYFRIAFDEYQFIGEKELLTIAGLSGNQFSAVLKNTPVHSDPAIYINEEADQNKGNASLQKLLFNCFKIESYLVYPVALSNGISYQYFFYSRQRETYTQRHIELLDRLKSSLVSIAEKIVSEDHTSAVTSFEKQINTTNNNPSNSSNYPEFKNIIGKHPLLLAVLDLIIRVAPYNTSVLILGESGTGKERIARSIHELSIRKNEPFIKVNCAAIPASLIESELFGHEKGAFTGATEKRKGKFEQADGGTIFLDEIGELSLDMQIKLLRVLQEREFDYVGGSSPKKVNVRVVAATNRNLEKEVAEGNFRLDLYYRLNVFPISLPHLRERKSDITDLAFFFAEKFCKEFNKEFTGIDDSMIDEMYAYNWPGNIRELENAMERSVILNDGRSKLTLNHSLTTPSTETPVKANIKTLKEVKSIQQETEREYIISVLKKTEGRIRGNNGAAEVLNIKPTTLESKMAKLGIKREDFMYSSQRSQ